MVTRRRPNPLIWIVAALAVFITAVWQQRAESSSKWQRVREVVPSKQRAMLLETLALIDRGGPYPYAKDGATFSNRERLLPPKPRGYYREYTVPTPGAKNRGARRIVQGRGGETYYTSDHYKTFVRIDE